ncbi:MAG: LysR family transcriptional regulator [Actinomycetota bacterium]
MDLTLHQLRLFLAVVDHGTIAAAADAVGYTPSAISQQLGGLEKAVRTPVFERVGRGLRLTDAGRILATHARGLLDGAEEALVAVARVDTSVTGVVNLGAFESVAGTLVPELLVAARARHPELEIRMSQISDPDDSLAAVVRGDLDLAFTIDYPHAPNEIRDDLERWTISHDRFHAVVPIDDPLPDRPVSLSQLAERAFISSPPEMSCGRCVAAACRGAGFEPTINHALDDYPTSLRLIAAGEGVALIPDLGLLDPPAGVRVLPLIEPVGRTIQLAVRRASASRPTCVAVRDLLGEIAQRLELEIAAA